MSVLMDRGPQLCPDVEIVSRLKDRIHRYTYRDLGMRARQLASALKKLGVAQGDRVATFAWNSYRHLEVYYAVPCMGAVLHTLNLRLSVPDLEYIVNHAEDKVILVDEELLPLLERLEGKIPTVKHFIVMGNTGQYSTKLSPVIDYETMIEPESSDFEWPLDR